MEVGIGISDAAPSEFKNQSASGGTFSNLAHLHMGLGRRGVG